MGKPGSAGADHSADLKLRQRFLQNQSHAEIKIIFMDLKRRYDALGVAFMEQLIVDCCCWIERPIKDVFPEIHIALDVYHFVCRYALWRVAHRMQRRN